MKKVLKILKDTVIRFMTIFTIAIFTYAIIDFFIFHQNNISFGYIMWGATFIFILSMGLSLFYQINKIAQTVQVIVTYVVILSSIYLIGFLNGWFTLNRSNFLVYSLTINFAVVIGLIIFFIIRRTRQIETLNQYLKNFKERNHDEKK